MVSLPYSRLFLGQKAAVVISGHHIQVLNPQTGEIIKTTVGFDGVEKDNIVKSGPIRCVDVDSSFTHLVTSGEDKQLKVWQLEDLKLLSERELPKKPTDVHFTRDGLTILVSDKFGDIFSYPLAYHPVSAQKTDTEDTEGDSKPRNQIISHENPSGGNLILGHTSLLTSFLLTADEQFIVSADRDEHIRVSWYPQGYVIERYCLGHKKFVHTVHIPTFAPSVLVSGGGDPVLKLWNWMSGELLCDIQIGEAVAPFIAVHPLKEKWGGGEADDAGEANDGKRRRRKGRGKGKAKTEEQGETEEAQTVAIAAKDAEAHVEDASMSGVYPQNEPSDAIVTQSEELKSSEDSSVLVVHRVASVDVAGQGQFLIFNAVGATAVFFCAFSTDPKATERPAVQAVQLDKPVVDFTVSEDGRIWALVDGENDDGSATAQNLVRLLEWRSGQLVEDFTASNTNVLLESLNSACKISATVEERTSLDIYSALTAMPKHVDPEYDPFEGTTSTSNVEQIRSKRKAQEPSQREQARMKKKQAVLAKLQEQAQESREASVSASSEDARDGKRMKAVE